MSGQVRPRQGTEICNFGAPSPLEALHWIFCFFSSIYVQFSKTSPLKSGESSEKSSGETRVKSCHVCGCHGFFGPDNGTKTLRFKIREHLRFSCVCVLKTLRFKHCDLGARKEKEANAIWEIACQNAAYLVAICDLELRFRATTGGRSAIWEIT